MSTPNVSSLRVQSSVGDGSFEDAVSECVLDMGHRQSVNVRQLVETMLDAENLDDVALNSDERIIVPHNGALYLNVTADAVDWFDLNAGDEMDVYTFPDAIVITRAGGGQDGA